MTFEESEEKIHKKLAFYEGYEGSLFYVRKDVDLFRQLRDRLLFAGILHSFQFLVEHQLNLWRTGEEPYFIDVSVEIVDDPDLSPEGPRYLLCQAFVKEETKLCKTNDAETALCFLQRFVRPEGGDRE